MVFLCYIGACSSKLYVNTCVSYSSTLWLVQSTSLQQWVAEDISFMFIGDNVDKKV